MSEPRKNPVKFGVAPNLTFVNVVRSVTFNSDVITAVPTY